MYYCEDVTPGSVFEYNKDPNGQIYAIKQYNFETGETEAKFEKFRYQKVIDLNKPHQDKYLSLQINLPENSEGLFENGSSYYFTINKVQTLVKKYQNNLVVEPLNRDSRILVLTTQGEVAEKEQNFLNALIEAYIQQDLENKNITGQRTVEFIDNQLGTITDSLQKAEIALQSFRSQNKIMDIGYASSTIFEKLDRLEQEKSQTGIKLRYYQNIHSYLQDDQDISEIMSPSAVGVEDPVLSSLIIELNRLYQQKAGLNYSTKRENPAILSLENQISSAKSSLIENLKNLIGSTRSTLGFINQQINQIESNIQQLPESERKLVNLQRKFDFNDQTYNFFLQKKAEAAISLATNSADRKFIDTAKLGGIVAPNKNFAIILAIILGLVLPIGYIIAKDSFNNKITSKAELKEISDIPILGLVAHAPGNRNVFDLYQNRKSALAESFNSIRLNLQYFTLNNTSKVIGVTSSISGEGKTFFAINLALEMAITEKRTILVGADLRKPRMQEYVGGVVKIRKGFGLSTFLANKTKLEEVIHKSPLNNLDIIPAGPIPPNPLDLMGSGKMKAMIETLKQHYDFIIMDTPPMGYVSEYMIIKEFTDTNVYIVRCNYSTTNSLKEINDLYDQKKIKNLCFVFNDVNFTKSYEYGYRSKAYEYYSRRSKKEFTISINKPGKNKKIPLNK